jgi:excisionase family DNA binding protein
MSEQTYTTGEAARELGVTPARVRQMIIAGLIETQRFGRAHVITPEALEAARSRNLKPGPKTPAKTITGSAKKKLKQRKQRTK